MRSYALQVAYPLIGLVAWIAMEYCDCCGLTRFKLNAVEVRLRTILELEKRHVKLRNLPEPPVLLPQLILVELLLLELELIYFTRN